MVWIIHGAADTGKTGKIVSLYNEIGQGDGFVSAKVFSAEQKFLGYDLIRLANGQRCPFIRLRRFRPDGWDECVHLGRFSFSGQGFTFAAAIAEEIGRENIQPVFIDEIGPLELRGQGFASLLRLLLQTKKDLYLSVRCSLVDRVIKTFGLEQAVVIDV